MVKYWVKTPFWLKLAYAGPFIWKMPSSAKPSVYLTFDDGPHPTGTQFILEELNKYNAKATFFCIGKNVALYPDNYKQIITGGHTVANHTQNHLNGWKTDNKTYIANVIEAAKYIDSRCMRPPYGRIKWSQARALAKSSPAWKIYMWDVLSADFDQKISPQQCADNVISNISPGSIVVFHDSDKAWERMSYALPRVLAYCKQRNWQMNSLPQY